MINIKSISTLLVFSLIVLQLQAQDFLHTNGKAIVNSNNDTIILRGMGLGGWMVQEGYMLQTAAFANPQHRIKEKIDSLIGTTNTEIFYDKWLENHCRKADIDSLASWGFNSVRLPMHYNLYTLPIQDEPVEGQHTWLDRGFEMTDSLISWCKQNDMWVILDLHAAPGGQGFDEGISDYNPNLPSLWESTANQDKTVALWKKLAERYADEETVGGYDLINEVNWNLPGGTMLRNLYEEITDSIRTVDNNHIIFIEGNWFANDFTGLTPPWDDNFVYSPHKYWSINDQASIQWVLTLRDNHNVPLYLGESGENSNVWFRDAIRLLEDNDIGWAWWPMKKVEAIAGPLSVQKSVGYQNLLNYWSGTGNQPSVADATAALMDLTEKLKIENCFYQKDVIDAMFRQVYSDETVPYNTQDIPGVVFASDYDMGRNGYAYFDVQDANYHVSTGSFTSWNDGWAYRNDGVDIEPMWDFMNTNGFGIGFTSTDEWMQYDVNVTTSAVYNVEARISNGSTDGAFHFIADGADVSIPFFVPHTGSYTSFETLTIPNVILTPDDKKLRLYVDEGGFNITSFKFVEVGSTTSIPTDYHSAITLDEETVQLVLNKPLETPFAGTLADFQIFVNGSQVFLTDVELSADNPRIVIIGVDATFTASDVIKVSHVGTQIMAADGTPLETFIQKNIQNTLDAIHAIPGKIEAEDYSSHLGTLLENANDIGGGQNVGFLDANDYMDYDVNVAADGTYLVEYRTASDGFTGQIILQKIDSNGDATTIHNMSFPSTGGWQTYTTTETTATLEAGRQTLRIKIVAGSFNINWMEFSAIVSTDDLAQSVHLDIYPNPSDGLFVINGNLSNRQNIELQVFDILGRKILVQELEDVLELNTTINLNDFENGNYFVKVLLEDGSSVVRKLIKL